MSARSNPDAALLEQLEGRLLMSGNVTVDVRDGWLRIIGDAGDNRITISQTEVGGRLIIRTDDDTTINGQVDKLVLDSVVNILAELGAGDDSLTMDHVTTPKKVILDMGDGCDDLQISCSHIRGRMRVDLGSGDDSMSTVSSRFDGRLTVFGGSGDDHISLGDSGRRRVVPTESFAPIDGPLPLSSFLRDMNTQFGGTVRIRAGAGNDTVEVSVNTQFYGSRYRGPRVLVSGGSGADSCSVTQATGFRPPRLGSMETRPHLIRFAELQDSSLERDTPFSGIVRTADEFAALLATTRSPMIPAPDHSELISSVDFPSEMVVAIFDGMKGSSGYSVEVTAVVETDTEIRVEVKRQSPPPGSLQLTVITYPYTMVAIPQSDKPVVFVDV